MLGSLLMVCVGNICRSPMAEAVMASRAAARGRALKVSSAGLAALVGCPADPHAQALLSRRGLDLSAHRARQVDAALLAGHELVLVMEEGHGRELLRRFPQARGRVRTVGREGGFDVPDPYGGTLEDFERALALIERGLASYERQLWGPPT